MSEINRNFTPTELRRLTGLTMEEVASYLGITKMTLNRKENGKSQWTAKEIRKLSELADIPIDRILF